MRPMHYEERPAEPIRAPRGPELHCKSWSAEAAMRMLMNNLDQEVAVDPAELIVYGGAGRAARNWREYNRIIRALMDLGRDETLCVQSGKPVYVAKTHAGAPRVIIANSNIVPKWSTQENFDMYDSMGLTMYGQMTAGSWIYIGTQGILQGTYETFSEAGSKEFHTDTLHGKLILTAGMGGMSGAQPMAATMAGAVIIDVEVRRERIERKLREGYCDAMADSLDKALGLAKKALAERRPLSIGLVGNAAEVYPELVRRGVIPDLVTDQTPAHDLLSYVPIGDLKELDKLRESDPDAYKKLSLDSIRMHTAAMLDMQRLGSRVFDYGNNLRAQAERAGLEIRDQAGKFRYPGFVPAYIRPMFCKGMGPFRWAALSGDADDIHKIDSMLVELFPDNARLKNWLDLASKRVPFTGLPARICWLGYGDRAKAGVAINRMVKKKELAAPIVMGRDHLDCGSVASPYRETEDMLDGSDAIADWPLLNFALNACCGASWVSFHNGGGVGIGNALHAGMVIVAEGTAECEKRLRRVLTVDPGIGVARHADAGYDEAVKTALSKGVRIPE